MLLVLSESVKLYFNHNNLFIYFHLKDAFSLPGVGNKIALKVWEIVETGCLRKVSEVCGDKKTQVLELFTNIWGVGPSTAETWYQQVFDKIKFVHL